MIGLLINLNCLEVVFQNSYYSGCSFLVKLEVPIYFHRHVNEMVVRT